MPNLMDVDFVWKGPRPEDINYNVFVLCLHVLYDASRLQRPGVEKFLMRLENAGDNVNFDANDPAVIIVPFDNPTEFFTYVTELISCGLNIELFKAYAE